MHCICHDQTLCLFVSTSDLWSALFVLAKGPEFLKACHSTNDTSLTLHTLPKNIAVHHSPDTVDSLVALRRRVTSRKPNPYQSESGLIVTTRLLVRPVQRAWLVVYNLKYKHQKSIQRTQRCFCFKISTFNSISEQQLLLGDHRTKQLPVEELGRGLRHRSLFSLSVLWFILVTCKESTRMVEVFLAWSEGALLSRSVGKTPPRGAFLLGSLVQQLSRDK